MQHPRTTVFARLACAGAMAITMLASSLALAVDTPYGHKWKTKDDETGEYKSIIEIVKVGTTVFGVVKRVLRDPKAVCTKCDGDKKDQPIQGMTVMWGLKKDGDVWSGGKILDPEKGKTYRCKIWMGEDGKTLTVRGYLGPFYRTQTWYLEE